MKLLKTAMVLVSMSLFCALTPLIIMSASWSRACKSLRNSVSVVALRVRVVGSVISTDEGSASKQKVSSSGRFLKVMSSSAKVLKSLVDGCASA